MKNLPNEIIEYILFEVHFIQLNCNFIKNF